MSIYVVRVEFAGGAYVSLPVKADTAFNALRVFALMNKPRLDMWGAISLVSCRPLEVNHDE